MKTPNPVPQADGADRPEPVLVRLTAAGARERVLDGTEGMIMPVAKAGPNGVLHVEDERFQKDGRPQMWTLGAEHYELLVSARRQVAA
jgi:hypothetical protein